MAATPKEKSGKDVAACRVKEGLTRQKQRVSPRLRKKKKKKKEDVEEEDEEEEKE